MKTELKMYEEKMQKTVHVLEEEFNTIRAGRANPHVLDQITVDYYGQPTQLNQVGNINIPEARLLQITPWDNHVFCFLGDVLSDTTMKVAIPTMGIQCAAMFNL